MLNHKAVSLGTCNADFIGKCFGAESKMLSQQIKTEYLWQPFFLYTVGGYIACYKNLRKREHTQIGHNRTFHPDEAFHWLPGHMFLLTLAYAFYKNLHYIYKNDGLVLLQSLAFSPVKYRNCRSCLVKCVIFC